LKVASTSLDPNLISARLARQFVSSTLVSWHAEHLIDTAALLTSELVTNAVLHADSEIEVRLARDVDSIRFEVEDRGDGDPAPRLAGPHETSGRGLALVDTLSEAWGVDSANPGKAVWFELSA